MKIFRIEIENFRLLKNFSMDLEDELTLVIGKNNTGKTSILSVLDKFLNEKSKFSYDDFNIDFKKELEDQIKSPTITEEFLPIGIKLKLFIEYDELDDLSNISRVLMDLDPDNNIVVLGFNYVLGFDKLIKLRDDYSTFVINEKVKKDANEKYKVKDLKDFIKREIGNYFNILKYSFEYDVETKRVNENNCINLESEGISLKEIVNFKYIGARRDVTNKDKESTLSKQTSVLYKKQEDNTEKSDATEKFKDQLSETDDALSDIYKEQFKEVIKKVQDFGGIKLNDTDIAIISTLQHRELLEGNTTVVYTHDDNQLPEHYNGLGYMNLISMIFEIEILVQEFKRDENKKPADINLLFIEEPEAHTHPQMQYVFIKNIKKLLGEGIKRDDNINRRLQYVITSHSSHIVADSDFEDIKYLKAISKNNVDTKNLKDLIKKYENVPNQYQFLKQYLTISRAEIFFADKVIMIEGDTERILIPTFMRKIDIEEDQRLKDTGEEDAFLPLLSQNISIIEVGAYSQIFQSFIEFLGIKTLIITDIDPKMKTYKDGKDVWSTCSVGEGTDTSNSAIKHFLKNSSWDQIKDFQEDDRTISLQGGAIVSLSYQQEEDSYHARTFEDSFIHINLDFIKGNKSSFQGLKNPKLFDIDTNDAYQLAESCVKKKTHFALDILYHSDENFSNWNIPSYIKNGLLWLKKD
ncbi:ATP-dependent nuclease [Brumimicrobium oceani]|uniref:ATP-dependent endonuclease n=1 Tax=Brumimicrobium oceani TaxID=2100725 RepID=A0A2U2XG61_9FLAO|nr:ATP-dependent endonuclease [Brumimicrobium oceani]PWH86753.1 ATP-dependent endonuclease [Brumimicrobium oceani]